MVPQLIRLNCSLKSAARPVISAHNDFSFPGILADQLISKQLLRKAVKFDRVNLLTRRSEEASQIKLIDGSKMNFSEARLGKIRLQPNQEDKLELQMQIRRMKTQERVYSLLLGILARESLKSLLLKRPIWRLTRVCPNSDMRSYIAYWSIDNPSDVLEYKVA